MAQNKKKNMVLEEEIDAFMKKLPELLKDHKGEYTLFKGHEMIGIYDKQSAAYKEGFKKFGDVPMLIVQVSEEYVKYGRNGKPQIFKNPKIIF
jgi:hypothetical protein